ncbi:MAG: AAA family ATPase [Chloroflexales bacterium]|nr:AAA family ATPase [Chloroflexales bacterium]
MAARGSAQNRSEPFGRLLSGMVSSIAYYEGKTAAAVEEDLGVALGVAGKTVQRYKAGYLPPADEAVRLLAEAAVRRGFLGREWLQRFLHAARYPLAEQLLDELCPAPQVRPRPPRVYENLPAPTYSQFVMREQAFAEVTDGLGKRTAAVLIVGLGGNGKTSLAREVAAHCLRDDAAAPRFDAAVWVSDKDRPGTTNLSVVLDEIARTLDYPGFTQFEHEEKRREVEQLLRRQRVLLVVDNFETISDGALLTWLLNLPEPSKALLTSREKHRGLWSSWLVELRGMTEAEAWELITERAHVLKIDQLVSERAELEPLLAATGGNPKALTMTLGLLKYERRTLQELVDDLYAARGDLFNDLFARAWALLDDAARRVLLVATFFPASARAEALQATADVQGFAFDRAVERLADLALLDVQQEALRSTPRYTLHPLVRAFAAARLLAQTELLAGARERWLAHFVAFINQHQASTHSEAWQSDLDCLEQELASLHSVVEYCARTQRWDQLIKLALLLNRVWSYRGYYEDRTRFVSLALHAAELEDKKEEQIGLLCIQLRTLCYLNEPQQAMACATRARALLGALPAAPNGLEQNINYSEIRAYFLLERYEPIAALASRNMALSRSPYQRNMYSYDLAEYYYRIGQADEAARSAHELLALSAAGNDRRGVLRGSLLMARIAMDQRQIDEAAQYLGDAAARAVELRHRRLSAEVARVSARLHALRDDLPAARASLAEAIDLFERLGMRRELAEAREARVDLDAGAASGGEPA